MKWNRNNILFFVLIGIGAGIGVAGYLIFWNENMQESSLFSIYTLFQVRTAEVVAKSKIFEIAFRRIAGAAILLFLCSTVIGQVALLLYVGGSGFALGSVVSILCGRFAGKGLLVFLFISLPQWIFYWIGIYTAYFLGIRVLNEKQHVYRNMETFWIPLIKIMLCYIIGAALEVAFSRNLLSYILRFV